MEIYGDGAKIKTLEIVSGALGLPIAESPQSQKKALTLDPEILSGQVIVVGNLSQEKLQQLVEIAPKILIECGELSSDFALEPPLAQTEGFVLSFTTKSVYQVDLPGFIGQFLAAQGFEAKDQDAIPLVLQEVIANAVLHGNMGIHSIDRSSLEGLEKMQNSIDKSLKDPKVSDKRIVIKFQPEGRDLLFSVRDQGEWLDLDKQEENVYGRGSAIIREYTSSFFTDKENSTVSICFKNSQEEVETKQAAKKDITSIHEGGEEGKVIVSRDLKTRVGAIKTNVHSLPILIVDHLPFNRQMIGAILKSSGFTNLAFAVDGKDAIEKIADVRPEMLILDVMMPNMDGYEVCRFLRKSEEWQDLPIIIQTALESSQDRNEAFLVGATDVVTKPINAVELTSRVMIHLENRVLVHELKEYQERLNEEFASAIKIQEGIFPSAKDVQKKEEKYGVEVTALFKPSSELTGDMWGFLDDDYGHLGLFVADFSGHGVSAAVNTFRLESMLRSLSKVHSPETVLRELTKRLQPVMLPGSYATMCYGIVDRTLDKFIYAAAGSTNPIVRLPNGETIVGDASGVPLGILKDADYVLREMDCPKDSLIFLYSDALTDNICGEDAHDLNPLLDIIKEMCCPKELVTKFLEIIEASETLVDDDLTLFAVRV